MVKEVWSRILETLGVGIYDKLAGAAMLVLTARLLGPEGRGVLAAIVSWVGLFGTFAYLSLGELSLHRAAQNEGTTWFRKTFGAQLFLELVLSGLAALTALALYRLTKGSIFGHLPGVILLAGLVLIPLQMWQPFGTNLLVAVKQLPLRNKAQVIGRTVGLVAVCVLVGFLGWGVLGAVAADALGLCVISLIGMLSLLKLAAYDCQVDRTEVLSLLRGGFKLYPNVIGACLVAESGVLILNYFGSKAEVGLYQFASQLVVSLAILPQATSAVLYARMSETGPDRLWPEQRRLVGQVLALIGVLATLAFLSASWGVHVLGGAQFAGSVRIFRWLLPAVLGMSLSSLMANQWIGRGLFLHAAVLTFGIGLANVVFNFALVPRYGVNGAIAATLISQVGLAMTANLLMGMWCDRRSRYAAVAQGFGRHS